MCSVGGDDIFENEGEKNMLPEKITKLSDLCNKCRIEKPCIVLRSKDTYCRNCFLTGTVHKFKASLGKSRLIKSNDQVLVWHKIGQPSTALLHFLRTGFDLSVPKRLRFQPVILFIDDQYHLSIEERQELLKNVAKEVQSFGFKLYFISFSDYIADPSKISQIISTDVLKISGNDKDLIINKKASKTNKHDIKKLLRKQLLIDAAKHCECKFVFTPEISVEIASELLSNVSLGRGSHISIDTGFCDDRNKDIKILKPLRSFDMKELTFYNNLNNLKALSVRQKTVNPYSSVQDLMTKFVTDLQVNYPATVTTILKTGDKLTVNKCEKECKICKGPLEVNNNQLTSQQSTNFSHLVSTELLDYTLSRQERFQNIIHKFDENTIENESICFACSNIFKYMNLK